MYVLESYIFGDFLYQYILLHGLKIFFYAVVKRYFKTFPFVSDQLQNHILLVLSFPVNLLASQLHSHHLRIMIILSPFQGLYLLHQFPDFLRQLELLRKMLSNSGGSGATLIFISSAPCIVLGNIKGTQKMFAGVNLFETSC